MKQYLSITTALFSVITTTAQPVCKIVSFDHFGGNIVDAPLETTLSHNDGSFSFLFGTNSTTSTSIRTDCPTWKHFRHYNATYTDLIGEYCAPISSTFSEPTQFFYPQPDGDTILIGRAFDDIAIERRSPAGEVRWSRHYGGSRVEAPHRVELAPDGTFLVLSGTTSHDGDVGPSYDDDFGSDIWMVKLDTAGNLVWGKVLGGTGYDLMSTVIPDNNGGCYLFGATVSSDHDATGSHGETDLWIVKLDGDGNKEWHKMLGGSMTDGSGFDNGVRAIRDSGSGFYVLARTDSHDGDIQYRMPMGEEDLWLLHIDSLANIIWENTYGGPQLQASKALCRGADGSIWMAGKLIGDSTGGYINVNYLDTDGWIVHADSMGNFLNQRVIGANKEEQVDVLFPLSDGTVLAIGSYQSELDPTMPHTPGFPESGEGFTDIFIVRLSPDNDLAAEPPVIDDRSWAVYPNPSDKEITINLPKEKGLFNIAVYNMEEKKVISRQSGISPVTLSTTKLSPGTYMIRLSDETGRSGSKKLTRL